MEIKEQSDPVPIEVYGDVRRISTIFYSFIAMILVCELAGIIIVLTNHDTLVAGSIAVSFPFILVALYFTQREKFETAAFLLGLVLISMITLVGTLGQGIHHLSNLGYPAVLIVASLVIRRRTMIFLTIYTLICIAWLVFGEIAGLFTPEPITHSIPGDFFSATLLIVATAFMARVLSENMYQANLLLKRELKEKNVAEKHLEEELTLRQQVEEELRKLNAELEKRVQDRTSELEATNRDLEAFSYSVSHDLRAPLRSINGYAKIIEQDFASSLDPEGRDLLAKVNASSLKMNQLIDSLLDFSRLNRKPLNKQPVDLDDIVKNTIDGLASEITLRKIDWILPGLPPVNGDLILIRQVFENLIGNAVKYTRKLPAAQIEVGCITQDGQTVYFVRDNGAGFDPKYAYKLFGFFQRLHSDDEFEGTGIGLAAARRIIERHGGRIWAEGQVDQGATFYFTFS